MGALRVDHERESGGIRIGLHAFGIGADACVHFRIGLIGRLEWPRSPAEIPCAIDQVLRPSLHVRIAGIGNAHRMCENPSRQRSGKGGEEVHHLSSRQAIKILPRESCVEWGPDVFDRLRHQSRNHRHALGPVLVMVLAHEGVRQKSALHRRIRVVRTEQCRVVLYSPCLGPLGDKRAADGFYAQHGRFSPQTLVDRVRVAREFSEGDGLVKRSKGDRGHGGFPVREAQYVARR
jgi:hypothetical protein